MKNCCIYLGIIFLCLCISSPLYAAQYELAHTSGNIDDTFGSAVAIQSDKILVGAPYIDDAGVQAGAVYSYEYDGSQWTQVQQIVPTGINDRDFFGSSVALDGDFALIGAYGDNPGTGFQTGSVYAFRHDGVHWNEDGVLTDPSGAEWDKFGLSVALAGDYAFVGSPENDDSGIDAGSVFIYYYDGSSWSYFQQVEPGTDNDKFGYSISADGAWVAIGAYGDDVTAENSGAVYLYRFTGTTWQFEQKIKAGDPASTDNFGFSVALDGQQLLIGSPNCNSSGQDSGAVYVFSYRNNSWEQQEKLTASDASTAQLFGCSLDLSRKYAVVGAYRDNQNGTDSGAAYLLFYNERTWVELLKFTPMNPQVSGFFGYAVNLTEDFVVVGSPMNADQLNVEGTAYVFEDITSYRPIPTLTNSGIMILLVFIGFFIILKKK